MWETNENGVADVGTFVPASRGCGYSEATLDYPMLYFPKLPDATTFINVLNAVSDVDITDVDSA